VSKDSSFDIVSKVDMQEVDNAHQQTLRELQQRYDLKGSGATIELDKHASTVTVTAASDFVLRQVLDVFNTKLVRREIDLKAVQWGDPEPASGGAVRSIGRIVCGIDSDTAKKIAKDARDVRPKVKTQVEGDKVRVTAAVKDDLQAVIRELRERDYGVPLQFINYR
jgi:uncharacterized protein YajQ (UPF0234 family)